MMRKRGYISPPSVAAAGARRSFVEEEEDGATAGARGAAADRGPEAAGDLLPEAPGGAGQEGGGAGRALRRRRRAPRPEPLRRHLPPLRRANDRRSKGYQVPIATTDKGPSNDDMSIDESSISQLTIEQLIQIERKVEYALRNTKARKLEADRIVTVQDQGKTVLEEWDLMKMVYGEEQKQDGGRCGTGRQQSNEEVDLTLSLRTGIGCDGSGLRGHEMPINLNIP